MKLFETMLVSAAILSATALTACSKSGSDNNGGGICTYNTQGQCVDVNGNVVTIGTSSIRYAAQVSYGNLSITNTSIYSKFLKNGMGVCDRYSGSNKGSYSCDDWRGRDVYVKVSPSANSSNQYIIEVGVSTQSTSYGSFYSGMDSGIPMRNPLIMQAVVSVINSNQGVEARQNVNLGLFQLQIQSGNLSGGTNNVGFQIAWGDKETGSGQVFATGTMIRY